MALRSFSESDTIAAMTLDTESGETKVEAMATSIYDDFDSYLKVSIHEYYDRGWKSRRGNFIALLIACGQTTLSLAKDSVFDGSGAKRLAVGAGAVMALRLGLKYALGGPLGLVLTLAAGASLVSYFFRNQKDIINRVTVYRRLIDQNRERYEETQNRWRDGNIDSTERNLMIDGMMKRFLSDIDAD